MQSIKLYGTASATANAVAQVVIPSSSRIVGVQVAFIVDSVTDNGNVSCELSKASAREIAVNGAQQCILEVCNFGNFLTSGLAFTGINQFFPVDVSMAQGQIVYLHATVSGTATFYFTGLLWLR